jgi:ACT domain-containing protein
MRDCPRDRHMLVAVDLPDRPGALGAVASRIGALGVDITDIHFGDRTDGNVVCTFHLDLPPSEVDLVELLLTELREVDGIVVRSRCEAACCEFG